MALTEEGHYYRRITNNAWTDGAHYREIGHALARGLVAYYNLPPVQPAAANTTPTNNYPFSGRRCPATQLACRPHRLAVGGANEHVLAGLGHELDEHSKLAHDQFDLSSDWPGSSFRLFPSSLSLDRQRTIYNAG